jgi:hypothetical protein
LLPALARASGLENLRKLTLSFPGRGGGGPRRDETALREILARLRGPVLHLDEMHNDSDLGFLQRLPRLPHLDRLASLDVQGVIDRDLQALAACPLTGLRRLVLHRVQLTPVGFQALAGAAALVRLREFAVNGAGVTSRRLQQLLESPPLRRLQRLQLWTGLGGKEAAVLAAWPGLSRLRGVGLCFRAAPVAELRPLLHSPNLRPLARLRLGIGFETAGERLPEQDLQLLRGCFGCRLEGVPLPSHPRN